MQMFEAICREEICFLFEAFSYHNILLWIYGSPGAGPTHIPFVHDVAKCFFIV